MKRAGWLVLLLGLLAPGLSFAQEEGIHYFAAENLGTHEIEQRGQAGSAGQAFTSLILAPQTDYRLWLLQASTLKIATVELRTPSSGQRFQIPDFFLREPNPHDSDQDLLPNVCEWVLGTSMSLRDTDLDGIDDGPEVLQGLDPLDGLPARTGVVASADTPGIALQICAVNDTAIVADGSGGVQVFNVFNRMNPQLIAQVQTEDALDVACSGRLAAVADGAGGLKVIDLSDPPAARILHHLPQSLLGGSAVSVEVAAQVAYVGLGTGRLVSVDIVGGLLLSQVTLDSEVVALAIERDHLFALTASSTLHALPLEPDFLQVESTIQTPFALGVYDLFVGGGVAYAVHGLGYSTVDVSDPALPQVIAAGIGSVFGWRGLAANGSGQGLATSGTSSTGASNDLHLYDLSDPAQLEVFQTTFSTPGSARGVALFNGLAYVADGDRGLQVVNYLPFDTQGIAPTISLSTSFGLERIEEGTLARVSAQVEDDSQVRNVEWYLDGALIATDGNFPFEVHFVAPPLAQQQTFTLRARASDTGGNATWSDELLIELELDSTAPQIRSVRPRGGGLLGAVASVAAFASEPLDPQTLTASSFTLVEAGLDGVLGTGDDVSITGGAIDFREEVLGAFLSFDPPLAPGRYRAKLASTVTDVVGLPLGSDETWSFTVFGTGASDRDGDGIPDVLEEILGLDADLVDSDQNGIPDGSEDPDSDGMVTAGEIFFGTDPLDPDTDGDMIADGDEDAEGDTVSDADELAAGTDPFGFDTDQDSFDDASELLNGSDPLDPQSTPLRNAFTQVSAHNRAAPAASFGRELIGVSVHNQGSPAVQLGREFVQVAVQNQAAPQAVSGNTAAKVSSVRNDGP